MSVKKKEKEKSKDLAISRRIRRPAIGCLLTTFGCIKPEKCLELPSIYLRLDFDLLPAAGKNCRGVGVLFRPSQILLCPHRDQTDTIRDSLCARAQDETKLNLA